MERVYSHGNGYIVVREHENGLFSTYLFDSDRKEILNERGTGVGGTYKSLENALRYSAKKAGASCAEPWEQDRLEERFGLTLIGSAEQGKAGGIMQYDANREKVGLWHLVVSVTPCYQYVGDHFTTEEVREFSDEGEAWAAYDAVRLRETGAYEANKRLERTVLTDSEWRPVCDMTVASEHYSGWAHQHERDWMAERDAMREVEQ